ncbi:MAG: hypothetical protein KDA58_12390, partial [Planctomycetaceae bacterium]|nr:hypothetical protein [Planctomycetaceae bacterium]
MNPVSKCRQLLRTWVTRRRQRVRRPDYVEFLEDRVLLTTFTVQNLNDAGTGSLREALAAARDDANTDADVIEFDAGLSGAITLSTATLAVESDVTIMGLGSGNLLISGDNQFVVFDVASGVTATIQDLTVAQGRDGTDAIRGGGIVNQGDLTLTNVILTTNNSRRGAALLNEGTAH